MCRPLTPGVQVRAARLDMRTPRSMQWQATEHQTADVVLNYVSQAAAPAKLRDQVSIWERGSQAKRATNTSAGPRPEARSIFPDLVNLVIVDYVDTNRGMS